MPKVLNKRTDAIPPDAVYVGRPSKWGNHFTIGKDGSREDVIRRFAATLEDHDKEQIRHELRGKDLVCWCAPLPCHADILLKIANSEDDAI